MPVDILAIAAHRDDVELTCAGTLLKAIDAGYRAGILDLTAGESGTRGTAQLRAEEADRAAKILGISERRNAGLPDAHLQNTDEARRLIVAEIRRFGPSSGPSDCVRAWTRRLLPGRAGPLRWRWLPAPPS
jgi:LmbE family N-acetylglucosaminyl deacetylase